MIVDTLSLANLGCKQCQSMSIKIMCGMGISHTNDAMQAGIFLRAQECRKT